MRRFIKALAAIMLMLLVAFTVGCKKTSAPSVETTLYSNVTATSATVGGFITSDGGSDVIERGVCWAQTANPDVGTNVVNSGTEVGSFSCTLTNLQPSTTYYVRAYACNSIGVSYGSQVTFTTLAGGGNGGGGSTSYTVSVSANPSNGGTVSGGGTYQQGQSCTVSATAASGYTFSNWTEGGIVVSYNANYTFAINSNRTLVANFTYSVGGGGGGSANGHAFVDLGLPSGLLWATCNVGATTPEGYGNYYAWGETTTKSTYSWSNYRYCNGSYNELTKYCNVSFYGNNGFTDNLTTLQLSDDAARANWGGDWRMPTKAECEELKNNTTMTWTTQNGIYGKKFTASNGNSLFLPAAGYRWEDELEGAGTGCYWSSSLYTHNYANNPSNAWNFQFNSNFYSVNYYDRECGYTVRPVRSARQN